jgi:hypothetical protein
LLAAGDCAVVLAAVGRSDADNQSSIIRQSAGRPKSVLELGAAEKKMSYFFHLADSLG